MPRPQIIELPETCPVCGGARLADLREFDSEGLTARTVSYVCGAQVRAIVLQQFPGPRRAPAHLDVTGCPSTLYNAMATTLGLPAWIRPEPVEWEEPQETRP